MKFYFTYIGDDLFELKWLKSVAKGNLFEVRSIHASIQLRVGWWIVIIESHYFMIILWIVMQFFFKGKVLIKCMFYWWLIYMVVILLLRHVIFCLNWFILLYVTKIFSSQQWERRLKIEGTPEHIESAKQLVYSILNGKVCIVPLTLCLTVGFGIGVL
jgi:hypothetical protein